MVISVDIFAVLLRYFQNSIGYLIISKENESLVKSYFEYSRTVGQGCHFF